MKDLGTGTRQIRLKDFSMRIISSRAVMMRKKVPGKVSLLTLPRNCSRYCSTSSPESGTMLRIRKSLS